MSNTLERFTYNVFDDGILSCRLLGMKEILDFEYLNGNRHIEVFDNKDNVILRKIDNNAKLIREQRIIRELEKCSNDWRGIRFLYKVYNEREELQYTMCRTPSFAPKSNWYVECIDLIDDSIANRLYSESDLDQHLENVEKNYTWSDAGAKEQIFNYLVYSGPHTPKKPYNLMEDMPTENILKLTGSTRSIPKESRSGYYGKMPDMHPKQHDASYSNKEILDIVSRGMTGKCLGKPTEKAEVKDHINPTHYQGYISFLQGDILVELQWLETMQYLPRFRNPESFKAAVELQGRKYFDRNGGKDKELQELQKGLWYFKFLVAYIKNGDKPIRVMDIDSILSNKGD